MSETNILKKYVSTADSLSIVWDMFDTPDVSAIVSTIPSSGNQLALDQHINIHVLILVPMVGTESETF
jgi:hypothetical protein